MTRLLVAGFEPFGGHTINPSAWLVEQLDGDRSFLPDGVMMRTAILAVDYVRAPIQLEDFGAGFEPEIVILFGLAASAKGFRLERIARNEVASTQPDNSGTVRAGAAIVEGGHHCASRLPLGPIARRLSKAGLPVEWSDDAGGYLCNFCFFHTVSDRVCKALAPTRAGFIHVPMPVGDGEGKGPCELDWSDLLRGGRLIVETCLRKSAGPAKADEVN